MKLTEQTETREWCKEKSTNNIKATQTDRTCKKKKKKFGYDLYEIFQQTDVSSDKNSQIKNNIAL